MRVLRCELGTLGYRDRRREKRGPCSTDPELLRVANASRKTRTMHATAGRASERRRLAQHQMYCHFLRDLFGNPFRSITVDPSWLTSTALTLASQMYDEPAHLSAMPILADALQDAGCDNDDILSHQPTSGRACSGLLGS